MGRTVPSNAAPMAQPMAAPMAVEVKPTIDEAVPAIAPWGSIASALKFGKHRPMTNIEGARKASSARSDGWPARATAEIASARASWIRSAVWDRRRMPSLGTSRALTKAAPMLNSAMPPKATGNQSSIR